MSIRSLAALVLSCSAAVTGMPSSLLAQCPNLNPAFRLPTPSGTVTALGVFDDGSGSALYVAGDFTNVEGIDARRIAKWDGSAWTALGAGVGNAVQGLVSAMTVFNDGTGPALIVAGSFKEAGGISAPSIAKWDGSRWSNLGNGQPQQRDDFVTALAVFNDGTGPALYAAGGFNLPASEEIQYCVRWNGTAWSPLDIGVDGSVSALFVFDDGTGPALYAGGSFENAGGLPAQNVARWNGTAWSPVGQGLDGPVTAFVAYDDGSGSALYAADGGLSKWDGIAWSPVDGSPSPSKCLGVYDDGTGPAIYVGLHSNWIGRWNGNAWSVPQTSDWHFEWINAMTVYDDGHGPALIMGSYDFPFDQLPLTLVKWRGTEWSPIGSGLGTTGPVKTLTVAKSTSGPHLYVGGQFHAAGSVPVNHIARFDGTAWSALGEGVSGESYLTSVYAITTIPGAQEPNIVVGGDFDRAGGIPAQSIAMWDGQAWSPLGLGIEGTVFALAKFDSGNADGLIAGGDFSRAGRVAASNVAIWKGGKWSALGDGLPSPVHALTVFSDSSGTWLIAGADSGAYRWDGGAWVRMSNGGDIKSFCVFDDGTGPALYAAGLFPFPHGCGDYVPIVKWNGTYWTSVGCGWPNILDMWFWSLAAFDDGRGPALFAGGIDSAGEWTFLFRFDGTQWEQIEIQSPPYSQIAALAPLQTAHSDVPGLFVGGGSAFWNGASMSGLGEWVACDHPGTQFCFGDGSAGACPCGNNGLPGHGCENSSSTGGAIMDSSGWTSVAYDSLVFTVIGVPSRALCLFLQGDLQFPPTVYGDGIRCTGGHNKFLYAKPATGGVASAPQGGDQPVTARSAALGDTIPAGSRRLYQVIYRDADPNFCPRPTGNYWNLSTGRQIGWQP